MTKALKDKGSGHIYFFATHGLITGDCLRNIKKSKIK